MRPLRLLMVFLCILTIIGCGSKDVENSDSKQQNKTKDGISAEIPEKVEDMIAQGPGKYAGDNYDEEEVKGELDKIDPSASEGEIYNTIMSLLAEDYSSVFETLNEFDSSYSAGSNKPRTDIDKPTLSQYNVSILLDASGSMAAQVNGGRKMDVAKEAIETFVSTFPKEANVSLIAYGHKGSNSEKDKQISCSEIEEIYSLNTYDKSSFTQALNEVDATGWTPLADAIKKSGETLKANADENSKNVVYVVSDGLETCGGNPAKEAKVLQKDGISATVNIIGFDINNKEQQALKEVAEAGGGTFTSADSKSELESYFEEQYAALEREWMEYGIGSYIDIVGQSTDKIHELFKVSDQFYEKKDQEGKNVRKAQKYLEEKGMGESFSAGHFSDYWNREQKIHEHFKGRYGEVKEEVIEHSNKSNEEVNKEVEEKKEELKKNKDRDTNND